MVPQIALQQPVEGMTLPGQFYTSDEVFALENERVFSQLWYFVGRREQLREPGDYFVERVAGESLIITLDEQLQPRAFYNVCRHRGTRLADEKGGCFERHRITCPYHSWTYSCDGQLLGAPQMDDRPGFRKEDWPLHAVGIDTWEGFLLVNLAEHPCPISESLAPIWDKFRPWRLGDLRVAHRKEYELETNWKLTFENFSECYHCGPVHPGLSKLSPLRSATNDLTEGLFLGGPMDLAYDSMTFSGRACAAPIRDLNEVQRHKVYYYTLMPNVLLAPHPDFVVAWRLDPQATHRTRIVCEWLFEPEAFANPGFNPSEAIEFWDVTNRQDWEVCEQTFAGISSRAYTPGPWGPTETMPGTFDREVLRLLGQESK